MRIAIINHGLFPFLMGGMERHTHFLGDHLARLGVAVDVIIPRLGGAQNSALQAGDHRYTVVQCTWPDSPLWLWSNYLFSRNVSQHLRAEHYDAVYCQGFNGWAYLNSVRAGEGPLTLYNPHGLEIFKTVDRVQSLKLAPMRWAARQQAKHADRVVSLGGGLTGEVREVLRVPPERIDVLPNAVDVDYIDRISSRAASGRAPNAFIFVGRLEVNKGVAVLCEAFSRVPHAKLTIVGSGPLERELRERYEKGNIEFRGRLDDESLFELYGRSSCFVFASLYEGMPTVILEAMACRLPIIATDIGAVRTMVDAENGIVVRPGSVAELSDAVASFVNRPKEAMERMGEVSRQRVLDQFTWPRVAGQTLELIQRLRQGRSGIHHGNGRAATS